MKVETIAFAYGLGVEYERGVEAKRFSLNRWKDRIATELGKTGCNRFRGKNKEFSSGCNFEVSAMYLFGVVEQPSGYRC